MIEPSPRFEKARRAARCRRTRSADAAHWRAALHQVKDLGSGNFGLARLERDRATGELVAVKYIERGEGVRAAPGCLCCRAHARDSPAPCAKRCVAGRRELGWT